MLVGLCGLAAALTVVVAFVVIWPAHGVKLFSVGICIWAACGASVPPSCVGVWLLPAAASSLGAPYVFECKIVCAACLVCFALSAAQHASSILSMAAAAWVTFASAILACSPIEERV